MSLDSDSKLRIVNKYLLSQYVFIRIRKQHKCELNSAKVCNFFIPCLLTIGCVNWIIVDKFVTEIIKYELEIQKDLKILFFDLYSVYEVLSLGLDI